MFVNFIESKGMKCQYIPNIKNDGINCNSKFYDWKSYFQIENEIQVVIDLDLETISYTDPRKEVRTSKEKSNFKNLLKSYAQMHDLKLT